MGVVRGRGGRKGEGRRGVPKEKNRKGCFPCLRSTLSLLISPSLLKLKLKLRLPFPAFPCLRSTLSLLISPSLLNLSLNLNLIPPYLFPVFTQPCLPLNLNLCGLRRTFCIFLSTIFHSGSYYRCRTREGEDGK